MKASTSKREPATHPPMEERFKKFATALMAVPKKELDKELAKEERKKAKKQQRS